MLWRWQRISSAIQQTADPARPASTVYQMRKLVARHPATFGFTTALLVVLAGFAMTMTILSARIAHERDKAIMAEKTATKVSTFLVDLFKVSICHPNQQ